MSLHAREPDLAEILASPDRLKLIVIALQSLVDHAPVNT
jgi:hypothetical protein